MRSQRTAIIVSLIIGLAIGIAILMVLWVCAVCFSKSRTKDEERQVHEEAKREQRAHQADAAVALPDVTNAPSEPGKDRFPTSHEYDGKLAKKSSTAPPVHAAATPPPVFPIDTRPAAGSPYPMVSPDPMPTRLSHHAGALPTPSPTQSRGGQHNSSPSPGKGMETNLHLSVPELVPSPLVHEVQEPRNSSPVIATVASPRVPSQKSDTEPRSHRTASARPRSKKRPSLAELDPMVPAVSHVDSQSSQAQGVLGSADAVPEDTGSAQGAAVPALDLNSITEERSKRNATKNKRSYVLEAEASGVGTTVEIDAISPVPGLPHTVSHANRGDSILEPTPQMPLDASEMMGVSGLEGGAAGLAQHGGPPEQAPGPLAAAGSGTRKLSDADVDAHVPVSVYEDAADTRGMTAIMDDQTTLMKGRGAALRGNATLTGVQERDGSIADTGSLPVAGASDSLPPGAIVRGRDEFLDQLKSKPGEVTGSIASGRVIHQDTTGIFASPWESSEQGPQAGIRGGTYVPSDMTSVMSGGSGMSTWTLSSHAQQRSVRRSAFSTMPSTSRSGRWSSRASHIAPSSSGHSNWTLSGEKSNWTVSGGDKSNFTMGGDQSNWTLSGNTAAFSTSHRVATRAIDDGRSEAFTMGFTEGASEWGLSPRGTARDDLDVGHSKRWLQNDEIVMPSRLTAGADDQSPRAGLRQKYEHRKLRQQYAADDTTVPETALRRVDEWMGDMSGTRDEVVKRLLAQTNGDE